MSTQAIVHGDRTAERRRLASELFDMNELEEETYRLALALARHVEQTHGRGAPIRALVAHVNLTLDELHSLCRRRKIRLGSAKAYLVDAIQRIVAAAATASRGTETELIQALGRSTAFGRRVHAAAIAAGDGEIARWSRHWLRARATLIEDAYVEGAFATDAFRRHDRFGMAAE